MVRTYLLSGAAAIAAAAFLVSNPILASAADIVEEPPPPENNWYVSLHGGIKFGEDWDDHFFWNCGSKCEKEIDLTAETDNGWRFGGAIGYMFSDIFAIEAELGYMNQDFDEVTIDEINGKECYLDECSFGLDGDVSILTGMINLIAGFPVSEVIRPYLGVGAGFAHVNVDNVGISDSDICCLDDSDNTFAAQLFGGFDFGLTENVALGIRGRLVHIGDVELEDDADCEHDVDPDLIKTVEAVLTFGF